MISNSDQATRHIRAFFENEPGFVLRHVSAKCGLSEMFRFELTLLHGDTHTPIDPSSVIGLGATVQIESPIENEGREYFGVISEIQQTGWSDKGITYRATMVPSLWFLTQRNNCRIFQDLETSEIVEQVLRDSGIDDFEIQLSADYAKREYCVQYRETDFNFISRLLEEDGIYYFFKHENKKHVLVLSDSAKTYWELEEPKIHFPKPGQSYPNRKELLSWIERYQFIPGSFSQKDFNFKEPGTDLFRSRLSTVQLPNNQSCEFYDYHGRYGDGNNGLHLTDIRMGEVETKYQTGFATSQIAYVHPAGIFRFGAHCIESKIGNEYVVTSVEFQARAADYVTGGHFDEDEFYRNKFTCIPSDRVFRPARRAVRPFVQGPQTAIVTTDGDEIMVDEHGRVKVHFHWDRYNKFDDTSSCWIRVSQVHAGEGFGMMDIPRKNEEVIVSFIEGDPDCPIITGRVYNGANRPPFDLKGKKNKQNKTRRGNATRTVGGGGLNEMSMDDTPGSEQLQLTAQHNMDAKVGNNQTNDVGVDRTAKVGNNEVMSVGVNQESTIGVDRTAKIGANDTKTIGANKTLSVGANQSTNVSANQSNSIGSNQTTQVGMMQNDMVGIMSNEVIGAIKTISAGVAINVAAGVSSTEQVGVTKKINVGGTLEITCGASKLTMDAGGKVTIEGTEFLFSASGNVKINGSIIDLN